MVSQVALVHTLVTNREHRLRRGNQHLAASGLVTGIAHAQPEPYTQINNTGTWCPGQRVPGGFTEVNWDWNVCHKYETIAQPIPGQPTIIGGLRADLFPGGPRVLVAGQEYQRVPNRTCEILSGGPC